MASRRRRRKSIGKVVVDVERRVRRVEKRPGATRLKRNVVTGEKIQYRTVPTKAIQPDAITANEAEFGINFVSTTQPTDYLKEGTIWFDPTDGATSVYDLDTSSFIPISDTVAQASADGKNTIYRQASEPTGGTYVTGDVWFDTDDDNKIYRYQANTATWVGFTLGNNALASISAVKITAGSLDAGVIVTSNLDAGQITTGTLTGRTIRTSSSGRRVEVDSSNNALSFYNAAGTALGHIRPATDQAGVIISSGGSATADFASSVHPKMIMYPAGTDGQFTLIVNSAGGGLEVKSASGIMSALIGVTSTNIIGANYPYQNRSFREIGIATAANYPNLVDIQSITGQEGLIVLTYS